MESYYILLGLPVNRNPGRQEIEERILQKQKEWSRDQNNPVKGAAASRNLSLLEDIRRVMLGTQPADIQERRKHEMAARTMAEEKRGSLKNELSLLALMRGEELPEKDLRKLLKEYAPYGFDENEIQALFLQARSEQKSGTYQKINKADYLEKDLAKKIETLLRQANMEGATLYQFLKMDERTSCAGLREAAADFRRKIGAKGNQSSSDAPKQNLCSFCERIFQNEAGKRKYDNYLKLARYGKLNQLIDKTAAECKKNIRSDLTERLLQIAMRDYRLPVQSALNYIRAYCDYCDYRMEEIDEERIQRKYETAGARPAPTPAAPVMQEDPAKKEREQLLANMNLGYRVASNIQDFLKAERERSDFAAVNREKAEKGQRVIGELSGPGSEVTREAQKKLKNWAIYGGFAVAVVILICLCDNIVWRLFQHRLGNFFTVLGVFLVFSWFVAGYKILRNAVMLSKSKKNDQNEIVHYRSLVDECTRTAQEAEAQARQQHACAEKLYKENDHCLKLPDPYRFDPAAYQKAAAYLKDGIVTSVNDIVRLLNQNL